MKRSNEMLNVRGRAVCPPCANETLWEYCDRPDVRGERHSRVNRLLAHVARMRFCIRMKMTPEAFMKDPPDRGMWLWDLYIAESIVGYGG